MRLKLACGPIALIGLSACSGLSTGVQSPCFERGGAQATRGLNFVAAPVAAPVGAPAETAAPAAIAGGADDCDFRDF